MDFRHCLLCCDDYPADLVVLGHCYLCREALSCAEARALDAPDDDAARELAAHYDATRLDYAEYACDGEHTPIVECDLYAYETATEARGEL
jgi:hypothetical protein